MIGRNASVRLAVDIPRFHARSIALLPRPLSHVHLRICNFQRYYATPGRPKTAVGEPSKTVKRAVKNVAAEKIVDPTDAESTSATPKAPRAPRAFTTKEPAVKKPKKPKVPKAKVKKELTEQQQAFAARRKEIAEIKKQKELLLDLKKRALTLPKNISSRRNVSAWIVYNSEKVRESWSSSPPEKGEARQALGQRSKENSRDFKALSDADREHYNHIANQQTKEKNEQYQEWIKSHTANQIRDANKARLRLQSLLPSKARDYSPLQDDRLVKRIRTSYNIFSAERVSSGDFKGLGGVTRAAKLISQEWTALSDTEKQKYKDLAEADKTRHAREFEETYGHAPTDTTAKSVTTDPSS